MQDAIRQSETLGCLPEPTFIVVCPTLMDAELEKLVEAGKLTSKAAEKLDALKPGTFCLHKSWGFGRIAEWKDRKSTRLNSSHMSTSYAVFCLKKKKKIPVDDTGTWK